MSVPEVKVSNKPSQGIFKLKSNRPRNRPRPQLSWRRSCNGAGLVILLILFAMECPSIQDLLQEVTSLKAQMLSISQSSAVAQGANVQDQALGANVQDDMDEDWDEESEGPKGATWESVLSKPRRSPHTADAVYLASLFSSPPPWAKL